MTSNFKAFKEFVEVKFESMSNFSFLATGSFQAYKGLQNLADKSHNRYFIDELYQHACDLDFNIEDVEITYFDRLAIKARMEYILETEDYKNDADWCDKNQFTPPLYCAIKNGKTKRKNCAYQRLINKLGL